MIEEVWEREAAADAEDQMGLGDGSRGVVFKETRGVKVSTFRRASCLERFLAIGGTVPHRRYDRRCRDGLMGKPNLTSPLGRHELVQFHIVARKDTVFLESIARVRVCPLWQWSVLSLLLGGQCAATWAGGALWLRALCKRWLT